MLKITRSRPDVTVASSFMDAAVIYRDPNLDPATYPDVSFKMIIYQKISRENSHVGDLILHPVNLFFETMTNSEQKTMYEFYRYSKTMIANITSENRREVEDILQTKILDVATKLRIPQRLVAFCKTPIFEYPDFEDIGNKPHHSEEKTYTLDNYIDLTALGLLSKIMVPIWGELVEVLGKINVDISQREKIAFDLIEPVLKESVFGFIYDKLSYSLNSSISDDRQNLDKNPVGNATTSYILTHNKLDDELFNAMVMANIIMRRIAIYECLQKLEDGSIPNVMAYIYDGIKKTADTRIRDLRNKTNTMPRRELPGREVEDNISVLDHSSTPSKKPFDIPIIISIGAEKWEVPRLLKDTETPMDVYQKAVSYYSDHHFDVSYLTEAVVSSFVGTRFGGSRCLNDLHPVTYQKLVVIAQIFLIKNNMMDLAMLISSISSDDIVDGGNVNIGLRINSNMTNSPEYIQCLTLFKGYLEKPSNPFKKKTNSKKSEPVTINFANHVKRMSEWIVKHSHTENMAPSLWEFSGITEKLVIGKECKFDESVIRNLCKFYLMMRGDSRPF